MNSRKKPGTGDGATGDDGSRDRTRKTPGTDMQPEDAGTAESGNDPAPRQGTAAEKAMKQSSKTDAESGGRQ